MSYTMKYLALRNGDPYAESDDHGATWQLIHPGNCAPSPRLQPMHLLTVDDIGVICRVYLNMRLGWPPQKPIPSRFQIVSRIAVTMYVGCPDSPDQRREIEHQFWRELTRRFCMAPTSWNTMAKANDEPNICSSVQPCLSHDPDHVVAAPDRARGSLTHDEIAELCRQAIMRSWFAPAMPLFDHIIYHFAKGNEGQSSIMTHAMIRAKFLASPPVTNIVRVLEQVRAVEHETDGLIT